MEVQDIIRNNPSIQKPSSFYYYLGRSYLSHALVGLRRQIKPNKDSISFAGLLEDIAQNPTELPLSYYRSLRGELVILDIDVVKKEFSKYGDPNRECVCPRKVTADLDELKKAAKACEEFADKRIAHRDKRELRVVPTYDQLDNCIKLLDKMYVKYHLLFYAVGMTTLYPEPQYDWKVIFREPWLAKNSG